MNILARLNAAATDPRLISTDVHILLVVASIFEHRQNGSYAKQETIAELVNVSRSTAQRSLDRLVGFGYLDGKKQGFQGTNCYRLANCVTHDAIAVTVGNSNCVTHDASIASPMTHKPEVREPEEEKKETPPLSPSERKEGRKEGSPTRQERKARQERQAAKANRGQAADSEFEAWYAQYPRYVARGAAEKAYAKARTIASAEELFAGAMRYAAERQGQDPQYTKHPATWLSAKGWLDEPTPSARPKSNGQHRRSNMDALADILEVDSWETVQ
jgi:hypothetical protein